MPDQFVLMSFACQHREWVRWGDYYKCRTCPKIISAKEYERLKKLIEQKKQQPKR